MESVVYAIGAVAVLIGALYAGRSRGKDELIKTQQALITAKNEELVEERRRCDQHKLEQDRKIAELSGRVQVLQEQHAAAIGAAIAPIVAEATVAAVVKAIHDGGIRDRL